MANGNNGEKNEKEGGVGVGFKVAQSDMDLVAEIAEEAGVTASVAWRALMRIGAEEVKKRKSLSLHLTKLGNLRNKYAA